MASCVSVLSCVASHPHDPEPIEIAIVCTMVTELGRGLCTPHRVYRLHLHHDASSGAPHVFGISQSDHDCLPHLRA